MKTNRVLSMAAVGVLWLSLCTGCRKDPPEPESCNNGTCCMQDNRHYDYVEYIENEAADLIGRSIALKKPVPAGNDPRWFNVDTGNRLQTPSVDICTLSQSKVAGLKNTVPVDGSPYPYHYRVWGKIYHDRHAQTYTAIPLMYIYIDRIEEAK